MYPDGTAAPAPTAADPGAENEDPPRQADVRHTMKLGLSQGHVRAWAHSQTHLSVPRSSWFPTDNTLKTVGQDCSSRQDQTTQDNSFRSRSLETVVQDGEMVSAWRTWYPLHHSVGEPHPRRKRSAAAFKALHHATRAVDEAGALVESLQQDHLGADLPQAHPQVSGESVVARTGLSS